MELDIWKGDHGLPSIDWKCLTVLAYCKFSDVRMSVNQMTKWNPFAASMPTFTQNGLFLNDPEEIFNHLRKQHRGADYVLSAKQSADCLAYSALVRQCLLPALDYTLWLDETNYQQFSSHLYSRAVLFPLSWVRLSKLQAQKEWQSKCLLGSFLTEQDRADRIYTEARRCLNILSSLLAEQDYCFGKSPTSLDALVFGCIAPLIKFPLPNPLLQNYLKECPNLHSFCTRILERHLAHHIQDPAEERAEQVSRDEKLRERRKLLTASLVAVSAMVTYAYVAGIIAVH